MKKKMVFLFVAVFLFFQLKIEAQNQNYGFTSSNINPSSAQLRLGNKIIVYGDNIYFTGTNNKVYCNHWDGNAWVGGTWPVVDAAPNVRTGTELTNFNDDIFYVGQTDSKIYRLHWTTSGWIYNLLVSTMDPVRDGTNIICYGNHIYYVNTNNKVCDIVNVNDVWSGGQQLVWTTTVNVKSNTQIIPTDIHVYFIGINDKVYDVVWNGTTWQGGNWPLKDSAPTVKIGTNIENDNNHLFYVGNNGKIHELIYTSGAWNGGEIWLANPMVTVRSDADLFYFENHIYYVGTNNKVCDLVWSQSNGWSGGQQLIWTTTADVKASTQIIAINKNVPIEGSLNNLQTCHHIFYIGTDDRIHFLAWDDNTSSWPCFDCTTSQTRKWYYGKLNSTALPVCIGFNYIQNNGMHLFYVNNSIRIQDITRTPKNIINKPGWILTRDDEFNSLSISQSLWDSQGPWSHGGCNSGVGNDTLWGGLSYPVTNWNNFSVNNGIGSIETKVEPIEGLTWGWATNPGHNDNFYSTCHYNYTTSLICSGGINVGLDCAPSGQYCLCGGTPPNCTYNKIDNTCSNYTPKYQEGVWAPNMVLPKFYQKYGWFEIRCKVPRGKHMWSAFWAVSKGFYPAEIDFFEIDGNGKYMLSNIYYEDCNNPNVTSGAVNPTYAVGYRYYDDYYTYACEWAPTYIKWYLNNELIVTENDPSKMQKDEMWIMINNYANNASARCEPDNFPNYYDIDYVRIYKAAKQPISERNSQVDNSSDNNLFNCSVTPNPNNGQFKIDIKGSENEICTIEIINSQGTLIDRKQIYYSTEINISDHSKGLYFVKFIMSDKTVVKKIIIQ